MEAILEMLLACAHCGFPVVSDAAAGNKQFSGLVLREQLMSVLRNQVWEANQDLLMFNRVSVAHSEATQGIADDINLAASFVTPDVSHANPTSANIRRHDVMRELGIQHSDLQMWVDIEAITNPCPLTVQTGCPLPKVIQLFCTMGLRHLPVVSPESQVVGMITRKDLHFGIPMLKEMLEQAPNSPHGFSSPMVNSSRRRYERAANDDDPEGRKGLLDEPEDPDGILPGSCEQSPELTETGPRNSIL